MPGGMTYSEYLEQKEIMRLRDKRRECQKQESHYTAVARGRGPSVATANIPEELKPLKGALLSYRKKVRQFNQAIERAKDIMEGGNIHSSAAGLGERHGGKKSDLSDVVAKAESMRAKAAELLDEIWAGRHVVFNVWTNGHISHNCFSYITMVYFAGSRTIDSKRDMRYIEQLRQGMQIMNVSFELLADVTETKNRP